MSKRKESCRTCRFRVGYECHRRAPANLSWPTVGTDGCWPYVYDQGRFGLWCGEYEPGEEPKEQANGTGTNDCSS